VATPIRLGRSLRCLLAAAAVLAGERVAAQPAESAPVIACQPEVLSSCMVTTRSGATFVGQVTTMEPGREVVLRLVTGEDRRVPWAAIASAIPAADPAPPLPALRAAAPPVPVAMNGMGPLMRLEQRPRGFSATARWGTVCAAPCQPLALSAGYDYRIVDAAWTGSPQFELPANGSAASVRVIPGQVAKRRAGIGLLTSGLVLLALAPAVAVLSLQKLPNATAGQTLALEISVGTLAGAGLAALGVGTGLFVAYSTRVQVHGDSLGP
jgi:hypothetical protein